jgi:serine/threonine protein kinase
VVTVREIGRYRIESEIGRGGMAVVYLARQLDLDSSVALKELAGLHAADATATSRFLSEARIGRSLNHSNIVTVYEYLEHGGIPYIAMELLRRGSLRPLVGLLSLPQIIGVLDGILAGLAHADERRIVHRDLKPENVMRSDDGGVKIADFGIAKAYDEIATANLTPAGEFVGAPAYVSPEQVLGAAATAASDLYAVGVIAFELFTAAVPFAGGTASALLIRKVNEHPPLLRSRRPDLDRGLADWVDHLLEREPGKRPSNPQKVRESLEDVAERLLGPHWRRDAALPAGVPARDPMEAPTAPPHRFASVRTLRTHARLGPLVANALSRPLNVIVAVVVAIAAALLAPWLVAVAGAAYLALASITFFDEAEAVRIRLRQASSASGKER